MVVNIFHDKKRVLIWIELEKGIILRHKAKDDLKTIDPSLFELEQSYKEGLSNFKRVNKSATNKIFARQISKETKEQEINKQKNVLVNVQLEDDGSELIERLCQDDTEFLKKVEGFLSKSRVLPINKMSTVVNQLDQVLHNLGDTADELDTLKGRVNFSTLNKFLKMKLCNIPLMKKNLTEIYLF